jgi:predicted Zn-dependent protease
VAAKAPDEDALILLQVVEAGDDPLEIVRSLEEKVDLGILDNAQQTPINGLNAVRSVITARTSEGKIGLDLTWIAHKGLIYQITGMSPTARFDTYRAVFRTTAMSFRALSAAERVGIQATRLRIASAQGGETLGQLIERVNGVWTPAEAAVANAIQEDTRLREGQLIKVPIREPYMTPTRPPTPSD